ncbi:hypothetical protein CBR_g505 [Chara braunii]|uniref:Uncharacterized protein n=1 Tax=Chara braunii TaxID=69332 RepID=A0A388KBG1_CHABU|nr:hypothetical protein CBR_g505 [Chara braunii]|eukprot:GBG67369.1 hypothetical protein CBR_g505 [Chara braunii]
MGEEDHMRRGLTLRFERRVVAASSEVDLETTKGQGAEEGTAGSVGTQGTPQKRRGDRADELADSSKKLKSRAPRTAGEKCKGTEGEQGRQDTKRPGSKQKQPASGPSSPPTPRPPIDVDTENFLEYKDDIRTKREFDISPAQVVDLGECEDLYNQRSLDPVLVEGIKEAMRLAFENKEQSYELPTLKLATPGLQKPTPVVEAQRLRPEEWRDELVGQYYYYEAKEKEEGDWFVQVPEPDTHCWKAMEPLTDNEKYCVLKKVLACEVVWAQAGSPALAKLGKLSVQEMVHLVKCDRVLVRLWNYYQFKHEKRPDADWIQRYPFLKTRSAIFKQLESRGLDAELWDGNRKYVTDSSLFKECPPYMGCDDDTSIEATEKLAGHRKLSVDWRNKVLSVLTGSRLKSREIALAEGIVHIKWKDTGDVTSIAPFGNDPLEAEIRSAEVKEAVAATKSHMFVLDLCEPGRQGDTGSRNNKTNMWFKLSERKRNKIYDFLFLQTRPKKDTDAEYVRRMDHVFTVLDNYHDASRMNAKTFLERLQSLYFVESEEELTFGSYTSLISTEDEEITDIEFDTNANEEDNDTESLDLRYYHLLRSTPQGRRWQIWESSDGFGLMYGEHRMEDDDDDETTMEMETQVVSNLSTERDDYEVQALTYVVDLQHRFNEAPVVVSLSKPSGRINVDDHHVSAQLSTTLDVDDPLNIKPAAASAIAFSLLKSRVDTQALDVLALPATTSPTKERRDKSAGKL